jgi:hypothetical protein
MATLFVFACSRSHSTIQQMSNDLPECPTVRWRQALSDGDDLFTKKAIDASDRVLDALVAELAALDQPATEATVLPVVERAVRAFNSLNRKHQGYICTLERDELIGYIRAAAFAVGVNFATDVTYEWREW